MRTNVKRSCVLFVLVLVLSASGVATAQECVTCWSSSCAKLKSYGVPACHSAAKHRTSRASPSTPEESCSTAAECSVRCDRNDGMACFRAASFFSKGAGVPVQNRHAVALFARACDLRIARACAKLGDFYRKGISVVPENETEALSYYRKSCALGAACDDAVKLVRKTNEAGLGQYLAGVLRKLKGTCPRNLDACQSLVALYSPKGAKPDATEERRWAHVLSRALGRACAAGDIEACTSLDPLYDSKRGPLREERADTELIEILTSKCNARRARACEQLSLLQKELDPVRSTAALDSAESIYRSRCETGEPESCFRLALSLARHSNPSDQTVIELAFKACKGGWTEACGYVGTYASNDNDPGRKLGQLACARYPGACYGSLAFRVGYLEREIILGRDVREDVRKVAEPLGPDCDSENLIDGEVDTLACSTLGEFREYLGEKSEALRSLQRACDHQDANACITLAVGMEAGVVGQPPGKDAIQIYRRACALEANDDEKPGCDFAELPQKCSGRDAEACDKLGRAYDDLSGSPGLGAKAYGLEAPWVERGCNLNNQDACALLAEHFSLKGNNNLALAKHACDQGAAEGCMALGSFYGDGSFVPKDIARAQASYHRACELGNNVGCSMEKNVR